MTTRHQPRPRTARLALVVAATLATAATMVGVPPGHAQERSADQVEISLVDQTTWLDPDGDIVVRFQLDQAPEDATVELTLHEPIADRSDFELTLDRTQLRGRLTDPPIVVGTVAELDPNGSGATITARLPIRSGPQDPDEPDRLPIFGPGIHPVDISVRDADQARIAGLVTHVVRPPIDLPASRLGLVVAVPFDGGPAHLPDGNLAVDDHTKGVWTAGVAALALDPQLPLLVAPRPEVVEALVDGGAALDARLVDDLAELVSSGDLPAMTYVDVDLDALDRAGLGTEIDRQFDRGIATLAATLGPGVIDDLWLADEALTTGGLDTLVDRGVSRVIVHHDLVELPSDGAPSHRPFLLGATDTDVVAITTDRLLQSHQGRTGDSRLDAQHLLANLAIDWFAGDADAERSAVVMIDPDGLEPAFVETLTSGLRDSPLLEPRDAGTALFDIDVDDLLDEIEDDGGAREDLVAALSADRSSVDHGPLQRDLDLTRYSINSFGSVFPDSADLDTSFDDLLAVIPSRSIDAGERGAYYEAIAQEIEGRLAGIGLPERRAITLPAREGTLPLTLTNTSDRVARVAVHLDSDKLEFLEGDRVEIDLPEGTSTVDIEVRARSSGAFPLEIVVASPDGNIELASVRYTIRSTAVSGVGVALSIAAIIVLAAWWFRTARRARADARASDTRDTGPADPQR